MPGFGDWAARWWMPVLFVVVAGHITNVCVTLFLHRAQTHRGVRLHAIAVAAHARVALAGDGHRDQGVGRLPSQAPRVRRP